MSDIRAIPCLGYRYSASADGQIIGPSGKPVKPRINRKGRLIINACPSAGAPRKTFQVHRLIVDAFIGLRPPLVVNHLNGNPLDNRIANLEQVSVSENTLHAYRTLWVGKRRAISVQIPGADPVILPTGRAAAQMLGVDQSTVCKAAHGRNVVRGAIVRFA